MLGFYASDSEKATDMAWTLDSLRGDAQGLTSSAGTSKRRDPLTAFYRRLDLMIYVTAVGLAACVAAIVLG